MKIEKWKVYEQGDADEFCLLMDDKRWVIAFRLDGGLYREQQKRVVDMIAAAPEMLAALKFAEPYIAEWVDMFDPSDEADPEVKAARDECRKGLAALRAAIAKAEGRADG